MNDKKVFGFSIIGCSSIANCHARAVMGIKNARLIGAYSRTFNTAKKFAKNYGIKAYENIEDLFADKQNDAVIICTPSGLHAKYAIMAANAKKHIVVEKPLAITKTQLDEITQAVEKNQVKLTVISQLRFTPAIQKLKAAIDQGKLGKILIAEFHIKYYRPPQYYSQSGWRGTWALDGGGALMNQGVHGVDIIQYLMGGIKSVYADCRTLIHDIETEDTANLLIEYNNGAIGNILSTTVAKPGYPRKIEVTGTKGTVTVVEDSIESWDVEGEPFDLSNKRAVENSGETNTVANEQYHKLQIEDLIDSIITNRQPIINHIEGRKPVEIILAAYESSNTNKKIILD